MFKNVLVGVDGRPNGRDAIALATRLTDPDGRLTLAHVHTGTLHPLHAISPGVRRRGTAALAEAARARARRRARSSAELVSSRGGHPGRRAAQAGRGAGRGPARRRLLQPRRARARDARRRHPRRAQRRALRGRDRARAATPSSRRRSRRSASPTTARRRARRRSPRPGSSPADRADVHRARGRLDPDVRVHRPGAARRRRGTST